ncbi:hypothetical protein G9F71_027045 [Clostridium sp. FP2]|uniref:DHHW family protein n=1 Tax=Clostridium sp. FP2 TaxID=2724481 RepID=UPI0013E980E8|nr:DHHW family protein [Clostridium sp. FP2]MBZ9626462.1 hypothetical protein [Clostridium sp. FP2]
MRISNKKKPAIIQNIVCMLPLLFILAIFILQLALPAKTYSREERRYLAQWPAFHIEKVLNGSYETKVESYFSDQFPSRNFWVHIQKGSNQILFKR